MYEVHTWNAQKKTISYRKFSIDIASFFLIIIYKIIFFLNYPFQLYLLCKHVSKNLLNLKFKLALINIMLCNEKVVIKWQQLANDMNKSRAKNCNKNGFGEYTKIYKQFVRRIQLKLAKNEMNNKLTHKQTINLNKKIKLTKIVIENCI